MSPLSLQRAFACAIATALCASPLAAHGGQYRGPWNTPAPPPGPGGGGGPGLPGPTTGTPILPGSPGPSPTTGGRPGVSDGTSWQVWWEFAKDPLIGAPPTTPSGPITGSDEYFLGVRRANAAIDVTAPTDADRKDRIAATLHQALSADRSRDLATACLVALAKVGVDPPGARLVDIFGSFLTEKDQEVRETAVLAFGIAGRPEGLDPCIALLQGKAAGKKLIGGGDVSDRTRAFAAWSLGLIAQRSKDTAHKQRVHDVVWPLLQDKDERSRDLRVALIQALGLLSAPTDRSGADKRLVWQTISELLEWYGQDFGKGDQLVQAHVPAALSRLLGRGVSSEHQRVKAVLAQELDGSKRRNPVLYQSAAIALGLLCLPPERAAEDAPFAQVLARYWQHGNDQLARYHSALALGRIAGTQNRRTLLDLYDGSGKAIERPWVALALGLCARENARQKDGAADVEVGKLLLRDYEATDADEPQAAFALALGLCHCQEAAPPLEKRFVQHARSELLEGYVAIAIAMLDDRAVADAMLDRLRGTVHRPFVLQQCAVALGRLGDPRAVPTLIELLNQCEGTASLAAVAMALGQIGDRRCIEPLVTVVLDQQRTKLARAFAAAALGGVGDKDPFPWNARIAADTNYMATVDTLTNGSTGVLDIL